jgi:uncharacterized membrane protein YcaP (DUF421 family)
MFDIELGKAFEIVARVSIIYLGCMVMLRVSGRREMSELTPMDLLAMLLLSETVSPALTGEDKSVPGGLIAAGTLIALTVLTSVLVFRSKKLEKIIQGEAAVLIDHGRVKREVMKKFRITDDDVENALHQHGLLDIEEVERAFVEGDGEITIVPEARPQPA